MRFEELKLTYGYPMQLQTTNAAGQPERYTCRLIGCLPGRSILVSVPKSAGRLVRFRTGQKVVLRFMIDNGIGVFISIVDIQTTDPYPILHISYPDNVSFKGIRSATRVSVDIVAQVRNLDRAGSAALSCQVSDISITGARVDLVESLGEIGEHLELVVEVDINGIARKLVMSGIIRSRVEPAADELNETGLIGYGVEFLPSDEEQRLVLYAYVFGQIVFQEISANQ